MSGDWYFRPFRPGDTINDPIERALFSQESVTGHPASALVREAIQNSLDARQNNRGKVTVRFALHRGDTAPTVEELAPLLGSLFPRLRARHSGIVAAPRQDGAVPLLIIEDFGTTGLTGEPEAWEPKEAAGNPFYLFFRALGRSGKSGEQRGRWGVGKFVFPLASQANCWFGYTRTEGPDREMLMGRCVLKTHELSEQSWHPDGTWGQRRDDNDFVLPLTASEPFLSEALHALRLERRTRSGLSVVVPWVREEVSSEAIRNAVVREYFLPIIRGDLEVIIEEGDRQSFLLSDSTLELAVARIGDSILTELVALARTAHQMPDTEMIGTSSAMSGGYPQWHEDLLTTDGYADLNKRLESGDAVKVRIPFQTRPQSGINERTYIDVAINQSSLSAPLAPLVIREGITIPDAKARRVNGFACLVFVDDRPIASLIGDAESPSHTQLLHELIRDKYVYGRRYLTFVREIAAQLVKALSGAGEQEDPFLLAAYFPATQEGHAPKQRKAKRPGSTSPIPDPPPRTPPRYHVRKAEGGFTIAGAGEGTQPPAELLASVAYEVRKGNPFKKYRPFDFKIGAAGVEVDAHEIEIIETSENRLRFSPSTSGFRVQVKGFDPNRNLVVRVTEL